MNQPTLFDLGDDTSDAPRHDLKCPLWLAKKIAKASGGKVTEAEALAFGNRQAHAVLAHYTRAKDAPPARARKVFAEPTGLPDGADPFVRSELARELPDCLAAFEAGRVSVDEMYRFARGALYALTPGELAELVRSLCAALTSEPDGALVREANASGGL
jgi:hypothetical protein